MIHFINFQITPTFSKHGIIFFNESFVACNRFDGVGFFTIITISFLHANQLILESRINQQFDLNSVISVHEYTIFQISFRISSFISFFITNTSCINLFFH